MNQVIVELDSRTLKRLNAVASAKKRQRSEFIRAAIRRALDALADDAMDRAYRETPPDEAEIDLDPETWEPVHFADKPKRKRSKR